MAIFTLIFFGTSSPFSVKKIPLLPSSHPTKSKPASTLKGLSMKFQQKLQKRVTNPLQTNQSQKVWPKYKSTTPSHEQMWRTPCCFHTRASQRCSGVATYCWKLGVAGCSAAQPKRFPLGSNLAGQHWRSSESFRRGARGVILLSHLVAHSLHYSTTRAGELLGLVKSTQENST